MQNDVFYLHMRIDFTRDLRVKILELQAKTESIFNECFSLAANETKYFTTGLMKPVKPIETYFKLKKRFWNIKGFSQVPDEVYFGAIHLFNRSLSIYEKKREEGKLDAYPKRNGKSSGLWFNRLNVPWKRTVFFETNIRKNGVVVDYNILFDRSESKIELKMPYLGKVVVKNYTGLDINLYEDKELRTVIFKEMRNERSMETNWYCELVFVDKISSFINLKTKD